MVVASVCLQRAEGFLKEIFSHLFDGSHEKHK